MTSFFVPGVRGELINPFHIQPKVPSVEKPHVSRGMMVTTPLFADGLGPLHSLSRYLS